MLQYTPRSLSEASKDLWLIHETELARHFPDNMPKDLASASRFSRSAVELELALLALSYESDQSQRILGEQEAEALLYKVFLLQKDSFPQLTAEIYPSSSKQGVFPAGISRLKRFVDLLRVFDKKELLLHKASTAEEQILPSSIEELILLLDTYENAMEDSGLYDLIGAKVVLVNRLGIKRFLDFIAQEKLAKKIYLDNPYTLRPLEIAIWQALCRLTEIQLLLDTALTREPTSASRAGLINFLEQASLDSNLLRAASPMREAQSKIVFSGQKTDEKVEDPSCKVWRPISRKAEVQAVFSEISLLLREGSAKPNEFLILAPDLGPYFDLLEMEASRYKEITVSVSKGRTLSQTRPAASFLRFLKWLELGSPKALQDYFASPLVAPVKANFLEVQELLSMASLSEELSQLQKGLEVNDLEPLLRNQPAARFSELVEAIEAAEISLVSKDLAAEKSLQGDPAALWIQPLFQVLARYLKNSSGVKLRQSQHLIPMILAQTAAFLAQKKLRQEIILAQSPAQAARLIRTRFFFDRAILKNRSSLELSLAYREIFRIEKFLRPFHTLSRTSGSKEELVSNILEKSTSIWSRLLGSWRRRRKLISDSVLITEIGDAWGIRGKRTYVLGLNREEFPGNASDQGQRGTLGLAISLAGDLRSESYKPHLSLEQVILFAKTLLLSAPLSGGGKSLNPSIIVSEYQRLVGEEQVLEREPSKPSLTAGDPRVSLIKSRLLPLASVYDGRVSSEKLALLLEKHGLRNEGRSRYSPSSLELFAKCPQTFFFSKVLGIKRADHILEFHPAAQLGNLVHRVLERVFREGDVKRDLFKLSQQELRKALQDAEFDWNLTLLRKNLLSLISRGIDSPEDKGRRGILKAALVFQERLLKSIPLEIEFVFGKEDSPPLLIPCQDNPIEIQGKIDRIDRIETNKLAVWDYKTGRLSKFPDVKKGLSLQLPLYAAFVREHFAVENVRAAQIALAKPERRDKKLSSITEGVVVEHVAVAKQGRTNVLSWDASQETIEKSFDFVREYDSQICSGDFFYNENQEILKFYGLERVAYRNPVKLASEEERAELISCNWLESDCSHPEEKSSELSSKPKPTEEQLLASDPEKSILLRASAGSGKTQVLRSRFVREILSGKRVEQIVAITFTEKSAAEIQTRIENSLLDAWREESFEAKVLSQGELKLIAQALRELGSCRIGTIHSFARRITAMDPALSRGLSSAEILTKTSQLELIRESFGEILHRVNGQELAMQLLAAGISFAQLSLMVEKLVTERRKLRACSEYYSQPSTGENVLSREYEQTLQGVFEEVSADERRELKTRLLELVESCSDWLLENTKLSSEKITSFKLLLSELQTLLDSLENQQAGASSKHFRSVLNILEEHKGSACRKSKTNPRNFWKESKDLLSAAPYSLFRYSLAGEGESFLLLGSLFSLAAEVDQQFSVKKRDLSVVDYNDLIELALSMLVPDKLDSASTLQRKQALLARIQTGLASMMVDEFQDTDELQWQLISLVAGAESCSLFVVGDSQQSIYGFRGGDSSVFAKAESVIANKKGANLFLSRNFRSHPSIIEFVNRFFSRLFQVDFFANGEPRIKGATRSYPMSPADGSKEKVEERVFVYSAAATRSLAEEAAGVGNMVSEILNSVQNEEGRWPALEKKEGNLIAVLVRKGTELLALARALDLRGIPYQIGRSGVYYDLDEIVQFENLFHFFADPNNKPAHLGVLRSPLLAYSDQDLVEICADGDLPVPKLLNEWHQSSVVESGSRLISRIIEEVCLEQAYKKAEVEGAFENITALVDLLSAAELSGESDGSALSTWQWLQRQRAEGNAGPDLGAASKPVILSTVHSSKGLEFPMVILPMLESRMVGSGDLLIEEPSMVDQRFPLAAIRVEDPEQDYKRSKTLSGAITERQAAILAASENRRVFYVACTRAEEYLLLFLKAKREVLSDNPDKDLRTSAVSADWIRLLSQTGAQGLMLEGLSIPELSGPGCR